MPLSILNDGSIGKLFHSKFYQKGMNECEINWTQKPKLKYMPLYYIILYILVDDCVFVYENWLFPSMFSVEVKLIKYSTNTNTQTASRKLSTRFCPNER